MNGTMEQELQNLQRSYDLSKDILMSFRQRLLERLHSGSDSPQQCQVVAEQILLRLILRWKDMIQMMDGSRPNSGSVKTMSSEMVLFQNFMETEGIMPLAFPDDRMLSVADSEWKAVLDCGGPLGNIITSVKEVMFLLRLVYLFVCLCVIKITQKVTHQFLPKF